MNKITLIGNLTKDLDVKQTTKGVVANGVIAVTREYNRDITDFITFTLWNKSAENAAKYIGKGSKVAIHGSLHIDANKETDKLYTSVSVESIEFLTPKNDRPNPEPKRDYGDVIEQEKAHVKKMKEETQSTDLPF